MAVGQACTALAVIAFAMLLAVSQAALPERYLNPVPITCNGVDHSIVPASAGQDYCALPDDCTNDITMGSSAAPFAFAGLGGPAAAVDYSRVSFFIGRVQAPLSIVIGNVYNNGAQGRPLAKIQYWIETDRFSLLEVTDSLGADFIDPGLTPTSTTPRSAANSVFIKAEFAGFTTTTVRRAVFSPNGDFIAPFWTVIINVDRGIVTGLSWDNSCEGCRSTGRCIRGATGASEACGINSAACVAKEDGVSCDVKLYVGWKGTDARNNYMLSAQKALSNFQLFSTDFAADIAARTARSVRDGLPDSFPPMPDIPTPNP